MIVPTTDTLILVAIAVFALFWRFQRSYIRNWFTFLTALVAQPSLTLLAPVSATVILRALDAYDPLVAFGVVYAMTIAVIPPLFLNAVSGLAILARKTGSPAAFA